MWFIGLAYRTEWPCLLSCWAIVIVAVDSFNHLAHHALAPANLVDSKPLLD